jgi:membrane-associated phospholipid phosphatase
VRNFFRTFLYPRLGRDPCMPRMVKTKYAFIFLIINVLTYFSIQALVTNQYNFLIPLDQEIPFVPEFIWVYHTLMPVIMLTLIFQVKTKSNFYFTIWSLFVATGILCLFYLFFPSYYPRPEHTFVTLAERLVELTYNVDKSCNTFPSGHVTFSWIAFLSVLRTPAYKNNVVVRLSYISWIILITLSTLTLKQHYVFDVVSGIVLALVCYRSTSIVIKARFPKLIVPTSHTAPTVPSHLT